MERRIKKGLSLALASMMVISFSTGSVFFTTDTVEAIIIVEPAIQQIYDGIGGSVVCFLDPQGKAHVFHSRGGLDYISNKEGPFTLYSLDNGMSGGGSVDFDSLNNVHLAYSLSNYSDPNSSSHDLIYTVISGGQWTNEKVVNIVEDGQSASGPAIVVDSQNRAHIVYYNELGGDLKYATNSGGSWSTETILDNAHNWYNEQIIMDSQDRIHFYFVGNTISDDDGTRYGDLIYVTNSGGSWNILKKDSNVVDDTVNFIVDSKDKLHFCYKNIDNELRYSTNMDGFWRTETISESVTDGSSLYLDTKDQPHIVYYDDIQGLMYITKIGSSWQPDRIIEPKEDTSGAYLVLDTQNRVHVIYEVLNSTDDGRIQIWYATNMEGHWNIQEIFDLVPNGWGAWFDSVFIDSEDRIHVFYSISPQSPEMDIMYATFTPIMSSPPDPPTGLTTIPGNGIVQLSWIPPTDDGGSPILRYLLLWSNDPNGPFDSIVVNGTSYLHEGLENGRTYYYEVIAVNAEGESEPSSVVSATPNPITSVPSAPMNLVAQASSSSIELTWDVPVDDGGSAITGYKVSYSLDPAGTFASIIVNGTSYLHDGLENGRTYYYQVSAINAHGEGIKTNMISATPSSGLILPSVPTNLVASIANGDVSLNWTAPSDGADITGYRVYRGDSPSTISLLTSTTNTIFLDTTVTSNRTYYYQVSAVNEYGESNRSNTVIVVMSSFDQTEPSPSFFETIEGQVAIAGMVVAGLGAVAYTLWHFRRTRT